MIINAVVLLGWLALVPEPLSVQPAEPEAEATEPAEASQTAAPAEVSAEESESESPSRFRRRRASGRYLDPESRFSLQGYVTGTFSTFGDDFMRNTFPSPGQLLVSRTTVSSFQYDWALFLGSRLNEKIGFVAETHFVTKGDGDFRPDIVATEAQITWTPFQNPHAFRASMGLFWAPFAGVNDDFFSAVNLFSIIPYAARAFPLHYNERGVAFEGEFELGADLGLNYVVTAGNGVTGMGVADQRGIDENEDKTLMGRIGILPLGGNLELAVSGAAGQFRESGNPEAPPDDPRQYASDFSAIGLDARYERSGVGLRSYTIWSKEELGGAPDLDRWGLLVEGRWRAVRKLGALGDVWLKARWDRSRLDRLGGEPHEDEVWNVGVDFEPARRTRLKIEGFFHRELDARSLDDDGFIIQLTSSF